MSEKINKAGVLDRIKSYYGLKNNAKLASFLGVAPTTISSWYARDSFDLDIIYSKCVDISFDWLLTGEGAMLALNSFPNVLCGHVVDPSDAYMFMQINDGNAIALPFAKGFGWGAELNLTYIFEKLFEGEPGGGYPKERVVPEQRNKKILDEVRKVTLNQDLISVLKNLDQDLVKGAVAGEKFQELFFANCKDEKIAEYVKTLLA